MPLQLNSGDLIADRFRILSPLGHGGHGAVYAAEQISMGRKVALKLLSPEDQDERLIERFYLEARQTSQLTHANTVICHDFGEDRARRLLFLAMEHLDGETLGERLRREGPLTPMRVLHIIEQMAGSLAEAHARGLIHRDLKPANVMLVNREGSHDFVKIIDFGIAKIFSSPEQEGSGSLVSLTRAGMVVGTPFYMAPEQIRRRPLDHRADVYAVAILSFQMLTGQLPFFSPTGIGIMRLHLEEPVPSMRQRAPERELPPGLDQLVREGMAKEPDERPSTISEYAARFRDILLGQSDSTTRVNADHIAALLEDHLGQPSESTTRMTMSEVAEVIGLPSQGEPRDTVADAMPAAPTRRAAQDEDTSDTIAEAGPARPARPASGTALPARARDEATSTFKPDAASTPLPGADPRGWLWIVVIVVLVAAAAAVGVLLAG